MTRENFWSSIKSVAAFLDGDRSSGEETLDILEKELRIVGTDTRKVRSDEMTVIIAQLSRLKMRIME
jgi:hypothetical protein